MTEEITKFCLTDPAFQSWLDAFGTSTTLGENIILVGKLIWERTGDVWCAVIDNMKGDA